ncbi:hypothetical protein Sru01_16020 [Sphaerisporangium rufum]|uniref:Transmembrane protein n=1 Tax=Sphaerisporangium rufum TaxID=1381558 RepID=A0A919V3U4_9ACTN|nr:DUF6069 family protein [Sphaerisporangium rufum]GII76620.1 hypothetical protein Sru01_16020 [Sphaerisporangium rufum]
MSATTSPPRTPAATRRGARALAVAGAAAAALAIWAVAVVAGVRLDVHQNGAVTEVGPAAVAGVALAAGLAGWAALAILDRTAPRRARTVWTALAGIVLVLSLAGPVTAAATPAAMVVLLALHLAVGAVLIFLLPARRRPGRGEVPARTE